VFNAGENAAKFPTKIFQFWGRGVPSLDALGVLMSLPKTNPLSTILDPPLRYEVQWSL